MHGSQMRRRFGGLPMFPSRTSPFILSVLRAVKIRTLTAISMAKADPVKPPYATRSTSRAASIWARLVAACAVAFALNGLLLSGTVAYVGQNPYSVHMDGPSGPVPCSSQPVITATVRDAQSG